MLLLYRILRGLREETDAEGAATFAVLATVLVVATPLFWANIVVFLSSSFWGGVSDKLGRRWGIMIPCTSQKMPRTKMNTSTDWNGVRSSAKPTMTERTPMIA